MSPILFLMILTKYHMLCNKKEKNKIKMMYLNKIGECKNFIFNYFKFHLYVNIVFKYNILNKYK